MIGKAEIKDTPEIRTEPRHEIYIQSGDASREDADRTYCDLLRQRDVQQQEQDPETLLFEAQFIPQKLIAEAPAANKDGVRSLCDEIGENMNCFDEVSPSGDLLPQYQKMLDSGEYDSIEELCNSEGLNYDDVYDTEPREYADVYKSGFCDYVSNGGPDPYDVNIAEGTSEAYYKGLSAASRLLSLLDK